MRPSAPRREPAARLRPATAACLTLIAGLALSACTSSRPRADLTDVQPAPAAPDLAPDLASAELERLAQTQRQSPDAAAASILTSTLLLPTPAQPLAPDQLSPGSAATTPLAALLETFRAARPAPPAQAATTEPADPMALRAYVRGRELILSGRTSEALTALQEAVRLDPSAREAWRELGEAQLLSGRRAAGMESMRRAVSLGLTESRALWLVGREALRARNAAAPAWLTAALDAAGTRDVEVFILSRLDLAEVLESSGHLAASREILAQALERLPTGQSPRFRAEMNEYFRRRGELWIRAGDLSLRLGDPAAADEAYARGSELAAIDPAAAVLRRLAAMLKQGRSADAALLLLADIDRARGLVEDRHIALIGAISRGTQAGPALARAVAARSTSPQATPSQRARWARAAAAALDPEEARPILEARLIDDPSDPDLIAAILATADARRPGDRAEIATRLCTMHPGSAAAVANMILASGVGVDETVRAMVRDRDPHAQLVLAMLRMRLGQTREARQILAEELDADAPAGLASAWLSRRAEIAAAHGDAATFAAAVSRLREMQGAEAAQGLAMALAAAARPQEALEALAPILSGQARVDQLAFAASLAVGAGQLPRAVELLTRAQEVDRFDERPYESLLALYAQGAPLASDERLAETARSLRTLIPSSRVIRGISAQELIARSLWSQAEPLLMGLTDPVYDNALVLELLTRLFERTAQADPDMAQRGERWLAARSTQRPGSPDLVAAHARVLAALGRSSEAMTRLEAWLSRYPTPIVQRTQEAILRDELGQAEQADTLYLERLAAAPGGIDTSLDFAEALMARGEIAPAISRLSVLSSRELPASAAQRRRALALLGRLTRTTIAQLEPGAAQAAVAVLEDAAKEQSLAPEASLLRLALRAAARQDDAAELAQRVALLAAENAELEIPALLTTYEQLRAGGEAGKALDFFGRYTVSRQPMDDRLVAEWVRRTALHGTLADARRLIEQAQNEVLVRAALEPWSEEALTPGTPMSTLRAELAYTLAVLFSSRGEEPTADALYRVALDIDPNHGWSANNLGFALTLRGELAEAERLLTIAIAALPDDGNVVDSVGWLRYHQGVIEDEKDERGKVTREGAVTVLKRAISTVDGRDSGVSHDHLGDALWRSGDRAGAAEAWKKAAQLLRMRLDLHDAEVRERRARAAQEGAAAAEEVPEPRFITEYRERLANVTQKLAAAERGEAPAIAPMHAGERPSATGTTVETRP